MKSDKVMMRKSDLLKEHKKLIKILRKGSLKQRIKEAEDQAKEMAKYGALQQH